MYVGNLVTGCHTVSEACDFYNESKDLFKRVSMNLREWATNSKELREYIPECDLHKHSKLSVLGVTWHTDSDVVTISVPNMNNQATSKREVLKRIASLFDPLGYFSPITVKAKIFLQNLWFDKLGWDERLSPKRQEEWDTIAEDLRKIHQLHMPRYVGVPTPMSSEQYQLLCFCDASTKSYSAGVYLRISSHSQTVTRLLFAKTRLAPTKSVTIPRIELLAVLIGVRGLKFVHDQL